MCFFPMNRIINAVSPSCTLHVARNSPASSPFIYFLVTTIEHQRQAKEAAALKLHMPMASRFSTKEIDRITSNLICTMTGVK